MLKKIGIAVLLIGAVGFVLSRTTFCGSHMSTAWKKVRVNAQKQVPLEFEIDRLRNEVAQLGPDLRDKIQLVAREQAAVEKLRKQVDETRAQVQKQKDNVRTMKDDLKSGVTPIVYDGRAFSAIAVREKLVRDLESCQRCEEGLKQKEALLEAKEKSLNAALEQLDSIKAQKEELMVQIAQLETEVKNLRVAQTKSEFQLDNSRLARIKAGLNDARERLRAEQIETDLVGRFSSDPIPVGKKVKTTDDVIRDAEVYLNDTTKDNVVVEKK